MEEEEEEGKIASLQEDELSSQRLLMRIPAKKMSTADLTRPDPTQPKKGEEDADA